MGSNPNPHNLGCLVENILFETFLSILIESVIDLVIEILFENSNKGKRRTNIMTLSFISFCLALRGALGTDAVIKESGRIPNISQNVL